LKIYNVLIYHANICKSARFFLTLADFADDADLFLWKSVQSMGNLFNKNKNYLLKIQDFLAPKNNKIIKRTCAVAFYNKKTQKL